MFESFIEYMWYLFTAPYKKVRKSVNNWYILCQVFGKRFDEAKEDILRARDEGMVATCCHDMLQIHGADKRLVRYEGEDLENYRSRIAMYEEICRLGGTNEGVLLAIKTLGFDSPRLVRANELQSVSRLYGNWLLDGSRTLGNDTFENRWAEFYIIIDLDVDGELPISFDILRKTVRMWKEVGAKDNYFFVFHTTSPICYIEDECRTALIAHAENLIQGPNRAILPIYAETSADTSLMVETKNNLFYLDGEYMLDGTKPLNTYEIAEEA